MLYWPVMVVVKEDYRGRLCPRLQNTYGGCRSVEKAERQFFIWEVHYELKPAAMWYELYENGARVGVSSKKVYIGRVKDLWESFGDVPINPETECLEEPWGDIFHKGMHREEVWHWFEEKFDVSVGDELMGHEKELIYGDLRFDIVRSVPKGYRIWNIGRGMPDGYIPLCREGFEKVLEPHLTEDAEPLKAIRADGAWMVMDALGYGPKTVRAMEEFIYDHEKDLPQSWGYEAAVRMKLALPVMKSLHWAEDRF